jgi:hypothetical protein
MTPLLEWIEGDVLAQDPEVHGVALLREPAVRGAILDWLHSHLSGGGGT